MIVSKQSRNKIKLLIAFTFGIFLGSLCYQNSVKAASDYLVKINKQANCVTIYKQKSDGTYKPVKALICSTGQATKLGTYSLGEKLRWHTLDGPCYGQYCTRIYGGVLFHSVWYTGKNNPATLSISSYNKLGTTASHGCVRLTVAGAKWIYKNVPSGTKVVIYSSKNPGPLGKPKAIKLPYTYGWDPTDTDNPKNPWNKKKPVITGVKNQTVDYNSSFNILKGVKAKNTTGFNAKSLLKTKITYRGKKVSKVDTKTPGTYKVTYSLTDEIGRKAKAKAVYKVTAPKKMPVISGTKNVYVTSKKKLTKKYLLKGVTVKQSGKKLASKYIKVSLKKIKKNVYKVTYTAKKASVPAVATAKAYIDTKAPAIKGIANNASYRVDKSTAITKAYAKSLIKSVTDNYTKLTVSDVSVTLTKVSAEDKYKAVYKVNDQAGNKTTITVYLIPTEFVTISGPSSINVSAAALGCTETTTTAQLESKLRAYLLNNAGITAKTYTNANITGQLEITLVQNGTKVYEATFTVADAANHKATKKVQVTVTE
ncbi:MAG: L,D-transpeptidase [Butyribacter sp.]|nr:L,D-transpeptidase [bacterium]MDY3855283.1 L,D-transpeptidase [Butyribacter sp.]